ncbi:aquaporin-8 [Podargus strigoides]
MAAVSGRGHPAASALAEEWQSHGLAPGACPRCPALLPGTASDQGQLSRLLVHQCDASITSFLDRAHGTGCPQGSTCFVTAPLMSSGERGHPLVKEAVMDIEVKPKPPQPHWYERYIQPCVAELLASALFVFIGCLSVVEDTAGTGRLQPALVHGLAVGSTIAIVGDISGAHFNPAVSLAVWLVGGMNITMLIPYWISQLCGGMVGAGLAKAVTTSERYANTSGGAFKTIQADEQIGAALGGEIIMTTFVILVACMGTVNGKTKSPLAPLYLSFVVTAAVLADGGVSGACMNPTRAFGPAVVANYWDYHWVYWVGPVVAALLSGALVRLLMGDRTTRLLLK